MTDDHAREPDTDSDTDTDTDTAVIRTRGLTRRFQRRRAPASVAVADLDLSVAPGDFVGLLGLNGAGKSTTIKMLTGILAPTSGRVRVTGLDPVPRRRELAARIGVVFGQRSALWWDLPLRDSFTLMHRLHRTTPAEHRERLAELTELLDLAPLLGAPVRELSLGQRMRGELVAAMLHRPQVLFLDEPTIGLDVVSKARLRDFLRDLNARHGTTILLTTHDLPDVEALCRRVVVLDRGRLAHDGSLAGLHRAGGSRRRLVLELDRPDVTLDLRDLPDVEVLPLEGRRQVLHLPLDQPAAPVIATVVAQTGLHDLSVEEPTLEDVVHALHRRAATPDPD